MKTGRVPRQKFLETNEQKVPIKRRDKLCSPKRIADSTMNTILWSTEHFCWILITPDVSNEVLSEICTDTID